LMYDKFIDKFFTGRYDHTSAICYAVLDTRKINTRLSSPDHYEAPSAV